MVVGLSPGIVDLAVGAPPSTAEQARRLAAEQAALMPDAENYQLPQELLSADPARSFTSARHWLLGWPE